MVKLSRWGADEWLPGVRETRKVGGGGSYYRIAQRILEMNVLYLVCGDDPDLHVIKLHRTTYTYTQSYKWVQVRWRNQSKSVHGNSWALDCDIALRPCKMSPLGDTEWRVYGILCVTSCNCPWIYNILDKQSPVPGLFNWELERVSLGLSLMGRLWDIGIEAISRQLVCWTLVWMYETNEQSQGSYQVFNMVCPQHLTASWPYYCPVTWGKGPQKIIFCSVLGNIDVKKSSLSLAVILLLVYQSSLLLLKHFFSLWCSAVSLSGI